MMRKNKEETIKREKEIPRENRKIFAICAGIKKIGHHRQLK